MAQIPSKVGKYQIDSVLGRGGMGEVYKAHDPALGRFVALKIMRGPSMDDAVARERFVREAQAAGGLRHPNIVTIYDLGEVEGQMFIAMEFIQGDDLEKIIKSRASLSIEDRLNMMIQVCEGVSYAHKNSIVHRDLKPANIRIDQEGVVKIMDFGIAKMEHSNMTASGTVLGTPFYMSPEQVRGLRVDARSDVYALAAILYEVMTYEKAFPGDMASVFYKIVHEQPSPLSKFMTINTEPLQKIVDLGLEKDKSKRIQSAAEMANMLREARRTYREINSATEVGVTQTQLISSYHIAPAPTAVEADEKRSHSSLGMSRQTTNSSLPPTVLGASPTSMDAGPATKMDQSTGSPQPGYTPTYPLPNQTTGPVASSQGNVLKIAGLMLISFLIFAGTGAGLYYFVIRDRNANTNGNVNPGNDNGNTNTNGDDNPADYKAELANAKTLFQNKDYAKAASICESIIKKHPDDPSVHFLLGASRQKMLRNQEALVSYQQAVALDPTMDKAWQQIGFIYRDRMDYQNAESAFIKATEIDSGSGASWQGLADTYMIMQDYDKALAAYEKLLRIEPGNVTAHYNLGLIYLGKKDYGSAKRAFLDTIEINPNFAEAHNNLGLVYLHEGEVDLSILENEKAVGLKPGLSSAHYVLFLAYEQKQDLKRSGEHLRKYLEITGDDDPGLKKKAEQYK
jgi:serine/threonine protein kinase/Flp pilus assembly protein TadD